MWRIALLVPCEAATAFETALAPVSCALFRSVPEDGVCRIEGIAWDESDKRPLGAAFALAAAAAGIAPPAVEIAPPRQALGSVFPAPPE